MIAIDTHVWVYLVSDSKKQISETALQKIQEAEALLLSPFSCWEVALLVKKGRLILNMELRRWIRNALKFPKLRLTDITPEILIESVLIDDLHSDPADRIIVASCLFYNVPLVTRDRKLQEWKAIETIW